MCEDGENYKEYYEALKRKHDVANRAITMLEGKVNDLQTELNKALAVNNSLLQQVNINKGIMHETLTTDNQTKQENAKEIERLRQKIKDLGGDPD
jgi:SMC interacting uncharacterized protein involved in chromosome segregation